MIKLGSKVRDVITGFTGIATARVEYLNGCVQYALQPTIDKDGKMVDAQYFDHQRIEVLDATLKVVASNTGFDANAKPNAEYRG